MRKVTLLLMTLVAVTHVAVGQVDVSAVNKPIELLNEANTDIEDGNYKDAVQKLIAEPYQPYQITVGETTVSDTGPVVILRIWD